VAAWLHVPCGWGCSLLADVCCTSYSCAPALVVHAHVCVCVCALHARAHRRYMPQRRHIVATKAVCGEVWVFDAEQYPRCEPDEEAGGAGAGGDAGAGGEGTAAAHKRGSCTPQLRLTGASWRARRAVGAQRPPRRQHARQHSQRRGCNCRAVVLWCCGAVLLCCCEHNQVSWRRAMAWPGAPSTPGTLSAAATTAASAAGTSAPHRCRGRWAGGARHTACGGAVLGGVRRQAEALGATSRTCTHAHARTRARAHIHTHTDTCTHSQEVPAATSCQVHAGSVNDVAWHQHLPHVWGSVGDDRRLILWDTRRPPREGACVMHARLCVVHGHDGQALLSHSVARVHPQPTHNTHTHTPTHTHWHATTPNALRQA
jgi:hypothetical protein